jgi:hypothetical protein
MTTFRSYPYAVTLERVLWWCSWYTRDLDTGVARDRRDEVLSDVWEHATWAEQRDAPPAATARSIIRRAVRGVPADLSWRRAQLRATPPTPRGLLRERQMRGVSIAVVLAVTAVLGIVGGGTLIRTFLSPILGVVGGTTVAVAVCEALTVIAFVLAAWRRTRVVGALAMVPVSAALVHFSSTQLVLVSATVSGLRYSSMLGDFHAANLVLAVGLALFFAAATLLLVPARRFALAQAPAPAPAPTEG